MPDRWPVTIQPVGPVAVASRIWRHRGALHVTALAKATFGFVPDGPMSLEAPMGINVAEVPGGPMRTTGAWAPSDLVPLLPRADVTFVGHAYASAKTGARSVRVRLALSRPRSPGAGPTEGPLLLDKSLEIVGARTATSAWSNPPAAVFTRMPIVYERAFGGTTHHSNPIGTGAEADVRGRTHLPNVTHPPHTAVPVEPAGFAPVPVAWPLRNRLLPGLAEMLRAPVASLPEGVDLAHFHAAPFDQRVEFLRGDEWILLDRLSPKHDRLATRLPDVVGVARVYTVDGEQHVLTMRADSLWIDGDGERCCVVWRGSFPVPSEASLPMLSISAGVEQAGHPALWPPVQWPHAATPPSAPASPVADTLALATQRTQRGPALSSTVVLDREGSDEVPPTMVLSSTFVRGGTLVIDTEVAQSIKSPSPPAPRASEARADAAGFADDDTVDAESRSIEPAAAIEEEPAPRSIVLTDEDFVEEAPGELDIDVVVESRPAPAADPTRASGVVPLSAWRTDDDDEGDDAATRVRPESALTGEHPRVDTPPPGSVERPTSSQPETRKREGTGES